MTVLARRPTFVSLKAFRKAYELSQRDAAKVVAITQAEWCRFESGQRRPTPDLAARMAKLTGVPLATLLGIRRE